MSGHRTTPEGSEDAATRDGAEDATDGASGGADGAAEAASSDATDEVPAGIDLVGEDLAIGYPTTDEPVVEAEHVLLPAGEVTALVGPNGSGKSTLLKAMADQLAPESGRVLVDGEAVATMDSKALARRLGLLSQENESPEGLSVEELVLHGRYPHRGFFESVTDEDYAAVDRAIDLAGVSHLRDAALRNLSGGQKQLAWIAMVLAQETDVLLLDEPTNHLDLHHQLRVMDVVQTLNREEGVTVGVILHDVGQAARFADNLVAMHDGELYDWGPPDDVVTEELLADVFHVDATVDHGSPTGPHISPHAALDVDEPDDAVDGVGE
ncbi:ABC transporter ATP-binding protein [Halorubellus sp. PRR65]|uniref:ABC transporter ATP-binding protein n=1 Tax=Halorubellus sp. PRR65 TaxID=3098148 RepID=UPI002B25BA20|nr:ABC transporter ATP-binding protein [Halorubellus sp. PRR65]